MEEKNKHKYVNTTLCFILVCCLQKFCHAENLCAGPSEPVIIKENNTLDTLVVQINTTTKDVTLTLVENPEDAFDLRGSDLMVKKGLDFESLTNPDDLIVQVRCNKTDYETVTFSVHVQVENINDNPPSFPKSQYNLDINELMPIDTTIALIEATDEDSDLLYYTMDSETSRYFRLETVNEPRIIVEKVIDYDVIQRVILTLYVQDTPTPMEEGEPSFTASTTITINIGDIDNRPPWFQPCVRSTMGSAKICFSTGYRGRINLTERQEGALLLLPGPVYARDGDKSRNEEISYRIARGNDDNIFQIDEKTGNITMLKAADITGPISLTILASQVANRDQFAMTTVTIEVMKKSRNPPRFERERYEGYVYTNSGPDNMVLRDRTTNRPFRVKARDEDFATGINPDIRYEVQYSSYVNVTAEGFVLLKKAVRTDSFALQLRAVDVSTGESGTAALSVVVIPAVVPLPSEGYRAGDMALLGFVMAAILVLCLIVIGYLIARLQKGSPGTLKLSECLGPCLRFAHPSLRPRDSMQFTNDGFQTEGDPSRQGSRRPDVILRRAESDRTGRTRVMLRDRGRHCASCGLRVHANANHTPTSSPARHPRARANTEPVKSILAKERRRDERQKTVWFKENEDSTGVQVEIIPDNIGLMNEEEAEAEEQDSTASPPQAGDTALEEQTTGEGQDPDDQKETVNGGVGPNTDQ